MKDPTNHLYVIISEYLIKNRWLMKTYFSPKTIKNNLLRIVLYLPRMEYLLYDRLCGVVEKYIMNFGEFSEIYRIILREFEHFLRKLR